MPHRAPAEKSRAVRLKGFSEFLLLKISPFLIWNNTGTFSKVSAHLIWVGEAVFFAGVTRKRLKPTIMAPTVMAASATLKAGQ